MEMLVLVRMALIVVIGKVVVMIVVVVSFYICLFLYLPANIMVKVIDLTLNALPVSTNVPGPTDWTFTCSL